MLITTIALSLGLLTPNHPSEIVYPEYVFSVPQATEYREVLSDGTTVYIVEDRSLPLINVSATFRGGEYLDPGDKVGLSGMMASLVRSGGTATMSAEDVDEQFAYFAAQASVSGGSTTVVAGLNCLSSNFDECFGLWIDMLQHPGFQASRIQLEKDEYLESMKQRNDFPSGILRREYATLLYGDSYLGRHPVESSIQSITADDMRAMHTKIINPANMVVSISGDFDKNEMLQILSENFSGWASTEALSPPDEVESTFAPGIYYVDQDVSQGGVRIGLRSLQQGDPDAEAAAVMNYILGGGGFSSRITQRVRSDEGLAYSAGSRLSAPPWGDGVWAAGFESKSSTVALATVLVFEEIDKMCNEVVSNDELGLAKSALIERFPNTFQSKSETLGVFVSDELTNRPESYWKNYRSKIRSVTKFDVQRVAKRLLQPKNMAIVIVGDWEDIVAGDSDGRAVLDDMLAASAGAVTELPLRDPLSLKVSIP
jgi:zinc protease